MSILIVICVKMLYLKQRALQFQTRATPYVEKKTRQSKTLNGVLLFLMF